MKPVMAIIPAAGLGRRMQSDTEKPYMTIGGRSILAHTLSVFEACPAIDGYVLVVEPSRVASCRAMRSEPAVAYPKLVSVVAGGRTRQESVYLGLMALDSDTGSVLIHDAARPCVTQHALEASILGCVQYGAVISGTPSTDTLKIVRDGRVEGTPDRSTLWRAQTPQTFQYRVLRAAHEQAREEGHTGTDDAELVERAGYVVRMIEGAPDNIKLTTAEDLEIVERTLRRQGRI